MLFPEISDRKYDREFVRLLSYSLCYNEITAGGNTPEQKIYVKKGVFTMKNMNIPRSQMIKFLIFVPLFFAFSLGMNWIACQFLDNVKFETMLNPQTTPPDTETAGACSCADPSGHRAPDLRTS